MYKEKYYIAHLHMHSCYEGGASMEGHMSEGARIGIDAIWFTDHDMRLGIKKNQIYGFDFEDNELVVEDKSVDIEKMLSNRLNEINAFGVYLDEARWDESKKQLAKSYSVFQGWQEEKVKIPAASKIALTKETAFNGQQSMKMEAAAAENDFNWAQAAVKFVSSANRHQCSLISQVSLKIACMIKEGFGEDARLVFNVKMSQHPPEHKAARLKYIIGNSEGLEGEYTAVIPMDIEIGTWKEFTLNLSDDAKKYGVGGLDNVFDTIFIELEVRNGKEASCYIDGFQIHSELVYEDVRKRQKKIAEKLSEKYKVIPFVANEISQAGHHKNSFCTHVPLIDYVKKNHNVSHYEAVNWVINHGGIFSWNHPFDSWKRIVLDDENRCRIIEKTAQKLIESKCDGASLIEIGFPEGRDGFAFRDYLKLWDMLSKNAVFITGYGDSDNHSNITGWWKGNNFAAWIYAKEPTEKELVDSMKKGNLFVGDPAIFKGKLCFMTTEGHHMGQVIKSCKNKYEVILSMEDIAAGWKVQWVTDGEVKHEDETFDSSYTGKFSLNINEKLHFVRVEVYNSSGRCILLTNPIYFTGSEEIEIPRERMG